MPTGKEKLTYYNGLMWRTVTAADGVRVIRPLRWDTTGRPTAPASTTSHHRTDQPD